MFTSKIGWLLAAGVAALAAFGSFAVFSSAASAQDGSATLRITLTLFPLTFAGIYELRYAVRMAEDAPRAVRRMNSKRRRAYLSLAGTGLVFGGEF